MTRVRQAPALGLTLLGAVLVGTGIALPLAVVVAGVLIAAVGLLAIEVAP